MKLIIFLGSLAAIVSALVSCDTLQDSGGTQINNPTVEDMSRLESQWGIKPRDTRSRQSYMAPDYVGAPAPLAGAAPQPAASAPTAPEPAPLPQPKSAPPVPEPPQPATPAQIQKLKN